MDTTATGGPTGSIDLDVIAGLAPELWRLDPHTFAERVSNGRWQAWLYLQLIGRSIADAVSRGNGRLIINVPPGHGKSSLVSKWVPCWILDLIPDWRVIMASHGAELATEWGRAVRNELEQNPHLTTRLRQDSKAAHRWHTPQGGGMYATGVGGGITGFRANVILVDDPHPTWEDAQSATHRRRVAEWFDGTLYDRGEPGATIIILMHRWHEDDLAGHLIQEHEDDWQVIRLPALAEDGGADPLGRKPGEPLCPERYDRAALLATAAAVGKQVWEAKYQQNPLAVGGGRVYVSYLPERNDDKRLELRPDLAAHVSLDFNYNPGMHAIAGQHLAAADVITACHEVHGPYMRVPACLSAMIELLERVGRETAGKPFPWPELRVYGDPAGHQNRAETTLTAWQQVRNTLGAWAASHGKKIVLDVPAGQYPVKTRVDTFNEALCDALGNVHYRVNPHNCPRLVNDLKYLKADEQGLIDKRDESMSHSAEAEANRVVRLRPIRRITPVRGQVILGSNN